MTSPNSHGPKLSYSPQLDGLRAICVIFTMFNHLDTKPVFVNGTVGVDVFFALSGFLITAILLDSDWSGLRQFYIRRFFRIAPVYYFCLAATFAATLAMHQLKIGLSRIDQLADVLIPSLLMSRELASAPTLFGHAWTIGIEEKFYIIWPLIFFAARTIGARMALLLMISTAFFLWGNAELFRGYAGIAFGCMASILYFRMGFVANIHVGAIGLAAAYLFCGTMDVWYKNIAISAASALFIPSLFATVSIYSRCLSHPGLAFLGKLTFSMYMLHVLIFNAAKLLAKNAGATHWTLVFAIGYASTVAAAWIVYRYIEHPLILYGRRRAAEQGPPRLEVLAHVVPHAVAVSPPEGTRINKST